MWVVRVGGDDGELRPWQYVYVHSIESKETQNRRTLAEFDEVNGEGYLGIPMQVEG